MPETDQVRSNDVLGAGAIDDVKSDAIDFLTDPITVAAIGNPGDGNGSDDARRQAGYAVDCRDRRQERDHRNRVIGS